MGRSGSSLRGRDHRDCRVAGVATQSLEAVDKLAPEPRDPPASRELVAQGVGNTVAGLIGGLPVTADIVRGSVNVNMGAKSTLSTIFHGFLLCVCVGLFPSYLNKIPLAALARS